MLKDQLKMGKKHARTVREFQVDLKAKLLDRSRRWREHVASNFWPKTYVQARFLSKQAVRANFYSHAYVKEHYVSLKRMKQEQLVREEHRVTFVQRREAFTRGTYIDPARDPRRSAKRPRNVD